MKYLQEYIEEAQTKALNNAGAFFAFSNKQYDEAKKEGIKYVSMGAGLICPVENADTLAEELKTGYKLGIAQDIAENGREAIIRRELGNHEADYTGDITSTVEALAEYETITPEDIQAIFRNRKHTIAHE